MGNLSDLLRADGISDSNQFSSLYITTSSSSKSSSFGQNTYNYLLSVNAAYMPIYPAARLVNVPASLLSACKSVFSVNGTAALKRSGYLNHADKRSCLPYAAYKTSANYASASSFDKSSVSIKAVI
jgi:hypothetical protein